MELTDNIVGNTGRQGDDTSRCAEQFELGQNTAQDGKGLGQLALVCSRETERMLARLLEHTVIAIATPMKSMYVLNSMCIRPSSSLN